MVVKLLSRVYRKKKVIDRSVSETVTMFLIVRWKSRERKRKLGFGLWFK